MDKKKIKIYVGDDAPAEVTQGNLTVRLKDGFYETDHSRFAQWLEAAYGTEKPAPAIPEPTTAPVPTIPAQAETKDETRGEK